MNPSESKNCTRSVSDTMTYVLIGLGSNYNRLSHLDHALSRLIPCLHIERRTPVLYTEPIEFPLSRELFANVLLYGCTQLPMQELHTLLHALEEQCGRTTEARRVAPERIPLDADLIAYGTEILKPQDLHRPYVRDFVSTLANFPQDEG